MPRTLDILLADDNSDVRLALREVLEALGHRVTEAKDGGAALEIWRAHDGAFDAVISDFAMPEMTGAELADRLREDDGEVGILLVSSHRDQPQLRERIARGDVAFVRKPFKPIELESGIRAAMANASRRLPPPPEATPASPRAAHATRETESLLAAKATFTPGAPRRDGARPSRADRPWHWAAAAALFAGVSLSGWFLYAPAPELPDAPAPSVRRSSLVTGLAPAGSVDSVPTALHWHGVAGAAAYRATLFGVDETILWQIRVAETRVELPEEIRARLAPGAAYLWRAEALGNHGGRIAASELVRVTIAPQAPDPHNESGGTALEAELEEPPP